MKKRASLILATLLTLSLFTACGEKKEEKLADVTFDSFAVGYGKADITPDPETKVMIQGNNDHVQRLSTGVQEALWVNCIAFTDPDGTTVLLFGTDLPESNRDNIAQIRAELEEKTGVPADHIQINCSHTHSGPCQGYSAVPAVKKSDENIIAKCVQAGIAALESRKPAKMYTSFARPEGLNFVRHYILKNGLHIGEGLGAIDDWDILGHMEAADNLMQLVKFTREGEKDIVLINWQAHPSSPLHDDYYTFFSSQNVGVMRRVLLEKANVESVYILGGAGDVTTESHIAEEIRYASYEDHGTALANAAIEAFADFREAETGNIQFASQKFDIDGRPYELSAFGFGDFAFVGMPWEAFQTNAMAVKEQSPYYMTFYGALTNDTYGYLPDAFSWTYEMYESSATFVPQGSAELVEAALLSMLSDCFSKSGQTQKEKADGYCMDHTPKWNGHTYKITAQSEAIPAQSQHYQVTLDLNGSLNTLVVEDKALAEEILKQTTVKLLFDSRNVAVAISD